MGEEHPAPLGRVLYEFVKPGEMRIYGHDGGGFISGLNRFQNRPMQDAHLDPVLIECEVPHRVGQNRREDFGEKHEPLRSRGIKERLMECHVGCM